MSAAEHDKVDVSPPAHLPDDGTVDHAHDGAIIQRFRAGIGLTGGDDALSRKAYHNQAGNSCRVPAR